MTINDVQKEIITTNKSKVFVSSAAASGKSETLVNRIRYLLNQGIEPKKIVAITFTNNAASVMLERLGNPDGLFIGTVHSYCNYLLRVNQIDTSKILNDEQFDELFSLIEKNQSCFKEVDYLLVDEAQDSTALQFKFFELIHPKNFMYFFDIRQSIYGWADADPDYLVEKMRDPEITIYRMNQNYRNLPDILFFAKRFVWRLGYRYEDDSVAMRNKGRGSVIEVEGTPSTFIDLMKDINKEGYNWGDWFLLCRNNIDVDFFQNFLNKKNIPNDTFKQGDLTNQQIKEKMEHNSVKVLTVHSSKGLENKCVLAYNLWAYKDEEARICYVAATRAMDKLVWAKPPSKKKKKKKIENWE